MWPQIEQDLARLLSNKMFPALRGVPAYEALLSKGTGLPDPAACKAAATRIVNSTDLKTGIREFGGREPVKVQEWSKPVCRGVSATNPNGYFGHWWFDEELVQRWGCSYPPGTLNRKREILASIRPMLAVCFDWNDFMDLRLLRATSGIPVITGQGTHQPIFSLREKERHVENHNVVFIGGFTQVFVPFVNPALTSAYVF
jgi:hypothetical protein